MHSTREAEAAAVLRGLRQLVHGLRVTSHVVEKDGGLTGAQLFVLRELAAEPGVSIRRLSERTLTDSSSVSVVVARLVERGLVARGRDPEDGRRSVLAVTQRGQKALASAPVPYQVRLFGALQALPRPRLRQLHSGLAALMESAELTSQAAPLFFEDAPVKQSARARVGGARGK